MRGRVGGSLAEGGGCGAGHHCVLFAVSLQTRLSLRRSLAVCKLAADKVGSGCCEIRDGDTLLHDWHGHPAGRAEAISAAPGNGMGR